jgi:hypothetical protein
MEQGVVEMAAILEGVIGTALEQVGVAGTAVGLAVVVAEWPIDGTAAGYSGQVGRCPTPRRAVSWHRGVLGNS